MTKRVSYLSGCTEEAGSGFELSHAGSEVALSVRKDEIDHLDTVLLMGYFAPRVRGDAIKFESRGKTAAKGRSR